MEEFDIIKAHNLKRQLGIISAFGDDSCAGYISNDNLDLEKGVKVPIGTISNGRKKIAEGKWVPVSETTHIGHGKAGQAAVMKDIKDAKLAIENQNKNLAKISDPKMRTLIHSKISEAKKKLANAQNSMKHVGLTKDEEHENDISKSEAWVVLEKSDSKNNI